MSAIYALKRRDGYLYPWSLRSSALGVQKLVARWGLSWVAAKEKGYHVVAVDIREVPAPP